MSNSDDDILAIASDRPKLRTDLLDLLSDVRAFVNETMDAESRAARMYQGGVCPTYADDVRDRIEQMIVRLAPPAEEVSAIDGEALSKLLTYDELDEIIAADGRGWLQTDGVNAIFNALKARGLCVGEAPPDPWYAISETPKGTKL